MNLNTIFYQNLFLFNFKFNKKKPIRKDEYKRIVSRGGKVAKIV